MKLETSPDVIPGSIWCGRDLDKFLVRSVTAHEGDLWVHYQEMGTQKTYSCLVSAFQQRFTIYTNHDYKGSVWKLSSM